MIREEVYYAKADAGKKDSDLTDDEKASKPKVTDTYFETDEFSCHLSILQQVAKNLGVTVDWKSDIAVEQFVIDFNKRPYADRLRFGYYSPDIREFRLQTLLKTGKTLAEAEVLMR